MATTQMPVDGVFDLTTGNMLGFAANGGPEIFVTTLAAIDSKIMADAELSSPALDHTAALQAAINACPSGTILSIPQRNWRFTNLVVTSDIILDWNGSSMLVDPTPAAQTTGNPALWFYGSLGTNHALNNVTSITNTVVCTNPAHAANYPAGTWVRIKDSKRVYNWADLDQSGTADPGAANDANGAVGYQDRWEPNQVISSDAGTGVIVLSRPVEWTYDASPTVCKINPLTNAGCRNIKLISEVDPGGVYSGADIQAAPHLIKFDYCVRPFVHNVAASGFNLQAVNFDTCVSPRLDSLTASDAFRPTTGGHGYGVRFNRCFDGLATNVRGHSLRHLVDHTQSYACGSRDCFAYGIVVSAYAFHGLGEKRCFSVNDSCYSSTSYPGVVGWVVGNPSFAAAYQTRIESPTFVGSGTAAVVGYLSDDTRILNPFWKGIVPPASVYNFRGLMYCTGATNCTVRGGHIDGSDVRVIGSELITARNNLASGDTMTIKPDSLWIDGVTLTGSFGDGATSMYSVHVINCTSTKLTNNTFVSTLNTQQCVDVLMDGTNNHFIAKGNTFRGATRKYGFQISVAPTQTYRIEDNVSETGFNIRYIDVMPSTILREEGNAVAGVNTLTYAATISLDLTLNAPGGRPSEKTYCNLTLTGNATLGNVAIGGTPQAVRHGKRYRLVIKQDATGSRTLAYQSQYKFPGGTPTLSTAPNAVDILDMVWDQNDSCFYCELKKANA